MKEIRVINTIALVLLILSGLNWGSVALFNYDLVAYCCGCQNAVAKFVYFIFGAAAVYAFFVLMKVRSKRR